MREGGESFTLTMTEGTGKISPTPILCEDIVIDMLDKAIEDAKEQLAFKWTVLGGHFNCPT